MEIAKYTIKEAVQAIQELDLGEDTCNINQYIKKRMQNNDISDIINMERQDISPAVYHMLQNSQPTSAFVERSFSMLKKLLAKNRNFKIENVQHYMILTYTLMRPPGDYQLAELIMSQDLTYFAIVLCSKFRCESVCVFVC